MPCGTRSILWLLATDTLVFIDPVRHWIVQAALSRSKGLLMPRSGNRGYAYRL